MDLLKTLLLYMTLTMAGAVQEGPLPETVPTPTVPPAIIEEAQESPTLAVNIVTALTPPPATATPRTEPTITPNKAYDNLQMNSRGNDVRKLQKRLIELGYLPEGADDGAFGYQTRRAVIAFQQQNGLSADGVAGDATQTLLFQDPHVISAFTPEPTQAPTPTPTAPPTAVPTATAEETQSVTIAPPVTAIATASPEEAAQLGLEPVMNASIVMADSGARLSGLREEDGVYHAFYPQVWLDASGKAYISLTEFAACRSTWQLTVSDTSVALSAEDYDVMLSRTTPVVCLRDKLGLPLPENAVLCGADTLYLGEDFFQTVFHASTLWDADEATLLIAIPDKQAAQSRD